MTTGQRRALCRHAAKKLRLALAVTDGLPRDARARARRDRIEALLVQLETDPPMATKQDPAALFRLSEELQEWWRREKAFVDHHLRAERDERDNSDSRPLEPLA